MTSDQFRSSPVLVAAARELLNDPTLAQMIVVVQTEAPSMEMPINADAIASVRQLERVSQHALTINMLLSLAEPLEAEQEEQQETFGVDLSKLKPPVP